MLNGRSDDANWFCMRACTAALSAWVRRIASSAGDAEPDSWSP
jgi:hypothetical protein